MTNTNPAIWINTDEDEDYMTEEERLAAEDFEDYIWHAYAN